MTPAGADEVVVQALCAGEIVYIPVEVGAARSGPLWIVACIKCCDSDATVSVASPHVASTRTLAGWAPQYVSEILVSVGDHVSAGGPILRVATAPERSAWDRYVVPIRELARRAGSLVRNPERTNR